mgnify:CR=1 FL=1
MGEPSKDSKRIVNPNSALQAAGMGVWKMDLPSKTFFWDQQCAKLFRIQLSPATTLYDFLSVVHKEDVESVSDAFDAIFETQEDSPFDVTFRFHTHLPTARWIRLIGSTGRNEIGAITFVEGVAQDITTEKHKQNRAETNEQKLDRLIQRAPFAIAVYETKDLVVDIVNPAMLKAWGKESDILGMPLKDVFADVDDNPLLDLLHEVFESGIPYSASEREVKVYKNSGVVTHWFNLTFEPLMDNDGKVYAILNMAADVTEKVKSRKSLEAHQQQLLASFEEAPVGIAMLSANGLVFEMANHFCLKLIGRTAEQVIGKSMEEAMPELKGQGFDILFAEVIKTGTPFIAPEVSAFVLRNNNLEQIYVAINFQPQYDLNGEVVRILVVANDITQQVAARKIVEQSEQKLRTVISSAPAAMALFVGPDLRIDLFNSAFQDLTGKDQDITGLKLRELMPELINQPYMKIMEEVFSTGKLHQSYGAPAFIESKGQTKYGYYNFSNTPLKDDNGNVYAVLSITIDVTEEIVAKQKIAEAEEYLRGAVELAQMATWSFDVKQKSVVLSDRLRDWLGLEDEPVDPLDLYLQLPTKYQHLVRKALKAVLKEGSTGLYQFEHPLINKKTGQARIIHAQARVISNPDGSPNLLIGSALDVTEHRQLQFNLERQVKERTEELLASNKELAASNNDLAMVNNLLTRSNQNLEQFAYIASHDLQEPLRKIRQFGDLLRQELNDTSNLSSLYIERMQSAATRMSKLIKDLLAFARISSNNDETKVVKLDDVIMQVLNDLELSIQETNASIELNPMPTIRGDKGQLGQLFMNLISNAIKFHRPGVSPHIVISASVVERIALPARISPTLSVPEYHLIEVIDNGIGFDEKYTERIFQVFQRLHGKSEFSGTGIGLAICEKVVVHHGGAISAKSVEGEGSTFQVYFPILPTQHPTP